MSYTLFMGKTKHIGDEEIALQTLNSLQHGKEANSMLGMAGKGLKVDRKTAMVIANRFIIKNLRNCFTSGLPKSVSFPIQNVWIVPILLSYPDTGIVGEVGMIVVDNESGSVVGFTPKEEIEKIANTLYEEKKNEIEIAFS